MGGMQQERLQRNNKNALRILQAPTGRAHTSLVLSAAPASDTAAREGAEGGGEKPPTPFPKGAALPAPGPFSQ